MYDDLTDSDLPDPMENVAVDVVSDVNDIVSAQASVDARAAELKKILNDAHIKVMYWMWNISVHKHMVRL